MKTLTITQAARDLEVYIEGNQPVMLIGPGGIGKSAICHQVARKLGMDEVILYPALSDPSTFEGFPREAHGNGHAEFLPYGGLAQIITAKTPTICRLEDVGQAPLATQGILMQLLQERRVNDHKISDHVRFVLCANRTKDKAGTVGFLQTLKSRMAVLSIRVDAREVISHGVTSGWNTLVPLFLSMHPELTHDETASLDELQYPTPRQWERVAWITDVQERLSNAAAHLEGCIGEAAAAQYLAFVATAEKIPDPDECISNPGVFNGLAAYPDVQVLVLRALTLRRKLYSDPDWQTFRDAISSEHRMLFDQLTIAQAKPRQ